MKQTGDCCSNTNNIVEFVLASTVAVAVPVAAIVVVIVIAVGVA